MEKVIQADVDHAREAWRAAREATAKEQMLWATLNGHAKSVIQAMLDDGIPWSQAEARFASLEQVHRERIRKAWQHMDECATRYRELHARHKRDE